MVVLDNTLKMENENDIYDEITHFLSKKRREILLALYEKDELSQGEIARTVDTTVTSAANILTKFAQFPYRLIEVHNKGKYRYYSLTTLAIEYIEYMNGQQKKVAEEQIIHHSELMLLQKAKRSISEFQRLCDDDWDIVMDDCLKDYIECEEVEEEKENLVQEMLHSLALMDLDECENSMDRFLETIEIPILSKRIERFMEKFETIRPILLLLRDEKWLYPVNELLDAIVSGRESDAYIIAETMGIDKQYKALQETMIWLRDKLRGKERKEIFLRIKRFFPGQQQMCFTLAEIIHKI